MIKGKRLITFGCSCTFGQALPDIWDYKKNIPILEQGPSKYAWPQLLADKLNLECVNLGIPGSSNKEIWYTILNTEFFKDDIVIVMWSFFDRWCVIKKDELKYIRHQESLFFKYFHDDYDMLLDFYLRINHIQFFLQNKVKLLKHTIAKENPNHMTLNYNPMEEKNENIYDVPNWNQVIFSDACLPMNIKPYAMDHNHPGIKAHEFCANKIETELINYE